jgi:hypothetical protein
MIRPISLIPKSLSSGGPEEKVYPGSEGMIKWYGNLLGSYSSRKRERIGRNSRKLPDWKDVLDRGKTGEQTREVFKLPGQP